MSDQRAQIRAQCDRMGISGALSFLNDVESGNSTPGYIREWIDEFERREAAAREEAQRQISVAAVEAAQLAANTSRDAAEASRKSAFWTMWAAIAAASSVLFQLVSMLGE